MTDVDETIPLATLSITPQTPGVTAGTGTVNTIPLASLSITPNAPGFQQYPLFEVLDSNGNRIDTVTFENLSAGVESDVQVLTLVNNSGSSVDVTLTATIGDNGTLTETATSTLLSEDDADYVFTTDTYTVPANSTLPVYIKWRPPSTSLPGPKTWSLKATGGDSIINWLYSTTFTVTSTGTVDEENVNITVTIPYEAGIMQTDFEDIRFYIQNQPLNYKLLYKTDSTTATYLIQLPLLPVADPVTIIVYAGNSTATLDEDPLLGFYDGFTDGTIDTDKWIVDTNSGSITETSGKLQMSLSSGVDGRWISGVYNAPMLKSLIREAGNWSAIVKIEDDTVNKYSGKEIYILGEEDQNVYRIGRFRGASNDGIYYTKLINGSETVIVTNTTSTQPQWHRIRCLSGVYYFEYSLNGIDWVVMGNTSSLGFSPVYIGLSCRNYSSYPSITARFDDFLFVRHEPSTTPVISSLSTWDDADSISLIGGVIYSIPDLPELDLQNQYIINVGGVDYE